MRVVVLGSGTSTGVPRIDGDWGACEPGDPRNRRRRVSILVEEGGTRLLVDTAPDLREQCLDAGVGRVDAVLYTHDHADHTHGLDDLRGFALGQGGPVDVHAYRRTLATLERRFDYAFGGAAEGLYPPIVRGHVIEGPFSVGALAVTPFLQRHGDIDTLGFRFGPLAYSTDVVEMPEAAFEALAGVRVWIVEALRHEPHPTHATVEQALRWIARVAPEQAVLTHLAPSLDYRSLARALPPGVQPAYDGMVIEMDGRSISIS